MILFLIASAYWICLLYFWRKRKKQREQLEALIKQNAKRIDTSLNRAEQLFAFFMTHQDLDFFYYANEELIKSQNLIFENERLINKIKKI